mgnify:CR=1 FL=1
MSKKQTIRAQKRRAAALRLNMPPLPLSLRPPGGVTVQHLAGFDQVQSHPEHGLEPARVISIYRQAECGWACTQAELFEGIVENDGHLRACIEGRINAISGKEWQILAGGDDPESIQAAELMSTALKGSNFGDMIGHLTSARFMGWAGVEIIWDQLPDGSVVPRWFIDVPAKRFTFDSKGNPELINEITNFHQPLEPGKWLFPRARGPFGGQTVRAGLMRTAAWYSLFKKWSWRDWVIYAEKFGIPLVLGRYKPGATEEEKDNLEEAVEDIGEAGQATMSDETNVEIHEAQRGGDSNGLHRSIVKESNEEMSKLITGSTLTMQTGGNGSFAQADVHADTAFGSVQADNKLVGGEVAMAMMRPFLKWNGFTRAKLPRLVIHIAKNTDGLTRGKEFEMAQGIGVELDVEQVREELHFRTPPSPDRVLRRIESVQSQPENVTTDE